jgi:steroid delta-isomerase-like uncharacterized protein
MGQVRSWFIMVGLLVGLTPVMSSISVAQEATPAATTDCPVLSSDDVTTLATAWVAALNNRDDEQLATLLAPDYVHHWGLGSDTEGAAAYVSAIEKWHTVFPDLTYSAEQILAGENVGALAMSLTGTQTQPFMGFPASGKPVTWSVLFAFRVECGQIVETWAESDQLSRLQQQGAIASPMATPQP